MSPRPTGSKGLPLTSDLGGCMPRTSSSTASWTFQKATGAERLALGASRTAQAVRPSSAGPWDHHVFSSGSVSLSVLRQLTAEEPLGPQGLWGLCPLQEPGCSATNAFPAAPAADWVPWDTFWSHTQASSPSHQSWLPCMVKPPNIPGGTQAGSQLKASG